MDQRVTPMLARLVRHLPREPGMLYEPKWDGFRCLVFRDGAKIDMRSRNDRPLARYFPELAEAFLSLERSRFVVDGEIVVTSDGALDFAALLQRLHPADSRVRRLRVDTPALFIAFDALRDGDRDLCGEPFVTRRARLSSLLDGAPPSLVVTPATRDPDVAARWLERYRGHGIDGVVAKDGSLTYRPGKRAMLKVKLERTADCVVAGFRWDRRERAVGSLLLGLYDGETLRHVGLAASFSADQRRLLTADVEPLIVPLGAHPWEHGFNNDYGPVGRLPGAASRWAYGGEITWVPVEPSLVCELSYDHFDVNRFRHPPRFRRWRRDRDARSCTFDQFEAPDLRVQDVLPLP